MITGNLKDVNYIDLFYRFEATFLDIAKAFDKAWYDGLIYKLSNSLCQMGSRLSDGTFNLSRDFANA